MPQLSLAPENIAKLEQITPPQNQQQPYSVREKEIGFGYEANYATVRDMIKIADERSKHPVVRALALQIVANIPSHNYISESIAIGTFVQKNVRYVRDCLGVEQLHDPLILIEKLKTREAQGDCDDMALFIVCLLRSIGHKPSFRVVKYRDTSPSWNHIYVVDFDKEGVRSPKERIVLDAIVKDKPMGFEVKHASGRDLEAF